MPRQCSICAHPERATIDAALVADAPYRHIAARFAVSTGALQRHRAEHLPAGLAKAREAAEVARADTLLDRLRTLNRETADVLREAKGARDQELRLKAIARAEKQIELEGRLLGELRDGQTVNIIITPEWQALRARILVALVPFPDARLALAAALEEGGHADH